MRNWIVAALSCTVLAGSAHAAFDTANVNASKEPLSLLRITPDGEDVPARRQIVFQFNRPVVPVGRMERTAAEIPITVQPDPGCEWRWLNTTTLACQLGEKQALIPSTRYRISVRPGIKTEDGSTLAKPVEHEFITQRPRVAHYRFKTWKSPALPQIYVTFDQPVERESVAQHLYLVGPDGRRVALTVIDDPDAAAARRRFDELKEEEKKHGEQGVVTRFLIFVADSGRRLLTGAKARKLRDVAAAAYRSYIAMPERELRPDASYGLTVEPGIVSRLGPEKSVQQRMVLAFDTYPAFRFVGIRCNSNDNRRLLFTPGGDPKQIGRCNPMGYASLVFTAPVIKETIKEALRVEPDLAGGRKDFDPWENVYTYSRLSQPHRRGNEYSVQIPGPLRADHLYRLQAEASNLKDEFGRPLPEALRASFATDDRLPNFVFEHRFSVMEKGVDSHIPVVVTNLKRIQLSYELLTASGRDSGEKILDVPAARNIAFYTPIRARELIPGGSGAIQGYWDTDPPVPGSRHRESRWFYSQVTPWHVHVKLGHHASVVWVTRFDNGQPVPGARVQVIEETFGRFEGSPPVKREAQTDAMGIARLPGSAELDPDLKYANAYRRNRPHLTVRVLKGNDQALVPLTGVFDVSRGGRSGDDYWYPSYKRLHGHVKAWGFTAQGVYRAGNAIEYKLFVRDQDNRRFVAPPPGTYSLKVIDPTDKVVYEQKDFALNAYGAHSGRFTVPKTGTVGWYRFQLRSSYGRTWMPMQVLVADFTPAPFRVTTDLNGKLFRPDDTLRVTTLAKLHGGGPYASAGSRVTATVTAIPFNPSDPAANGYEFDTYKPGQPASETLHQSEQNVDAQGQRITEFKVPVAKILYGRMTVESAVRDDRGKYIAGEGSARYVGRDRFVGVRINEWVLKAGQPARVKTLVVNEHGKAVAGTRVDVLIEHRETRAARVKGSGNAYLTQYTHKWVKVSECRHDATPKGTACTFTPKTAGGYRMTARIKDTRGREHSTQTQRWAVGRGQVVWESEEGHGLDLLPEKTELKVGEKARFLVQNPYPGAQALITIERLGVMKSWVRRLPNSAELIEIPVTADLLPGFYVSVTVASPRVAKPLKDGKVDLGKPAFRIGYARVRVKDPHKELKLDIKAQKKTYKPRDTVTVNLRALTHQGKPVDSEIAVVVLDEAVFDLIQGGRRYYDPYGAFYKLDALDLRNFNLLTQLLGRRNYEKKGANPGGDGGPDAAMRSVFKFVTYWNPSVKPDAQGRATIRFPVPDNLTGWRVLAVAVNRQDLMGLGEGTFQVTQATEIRPSLPNQVMEGDRFEARFTVMNRTDKPRDIEITIRADGALKDGKPAAVTHKARAEPFKRVTVGLPLHAGRHGDIRFAVRAGDAGDRDGLKLTIPVIRRQALETAATYGTTTQNTVSERVAFPKDMRGDVGRISVVASPSVIAAVEGAFEYLRSYPYVCWEQRLTKGVMASHYLNLKAYMPKTFQWPEAKGLPATTLADAANFQAPNGGMAYYIPTNNRADPYLSAYTAIAFNWMRAAGHPVPPGVEERLHRYLLSFLRRDVAPDWYTRGMSSTVRAVALAALAEHGKISLADLERYRSHLKEMSLFGKAHYLMAALRVPGSEPIRAEAIKLIRAHANETGGKFVFSEQLDFAYKQILDSSLRSNCAILTAFVTHEDPARGKGAASDLPFKLVRTISQTRKQKNRWENTQENMFCINALIEYARQYEKESPEMIIRVALNGQPLGQGRLSGFRAPALDLGRDVTAADPGKKTTMTITREGRGRLYYSTRLQYSPATLKPRSINSGIEIEREYSVERNGRWVLLKEPMQIKQGELVRVDLYVSLPAPRNFVVVDDPVPGGLEPVNRQLATASKVDADKGKFMYGEGSIWWRHGDWHAYGIEYWSFYHQELRHHAARFYSQYLPAGRYHLSYVAQAIAPGRFTVGPAHAEEMYDPDVFGQSVPGTLQVAPP